MFSPDNFSSPRIAYKAFDGDIAVVQEIARAYGIIGDVSLVEALDRNEINSKNLKVCIGDRIYLLRKHQAVTDACQLALNLSIIARLHADGVPVSRPVPTEEGEWYIAYSGERYSFFEFLAANHFAPTREGYRNVARALASMHQSLCGLPQEMGEDIERLSKNTKAYFNVVPTYTQKDLDDVLVVITERNEKTKEDMMILAAGDRLSATITAVLQHQERQAPLPQQITHSDVHPHNVMLYGDQVAAIIDFDGMRKSERARDVAFALYRLGRQFFVGREIVAAQQDARELVEEFLDAYAEVSPLSDAERNALGMLLRDEFMKKTLFLLKGIYLEHNYTWASDLHKFLDAFQEIDAFFPSQYE